MTTRGTVEPGSALTNKYRLEMTGLPPLNVVSIGEQSETLVTAEMPDLTRQTTGQVKAIDTEITIMAHHPAEVVALEVWYALCKAGGPLHKLVGFLHYLGADGSTKLTHMWDGTLLTGRKTPALETKGDAEGLMLTYTVSIDAVVPV